MSDQVIPHAAGEAARMMIRAWAEDHGMELLQGREGEKYPVVERRGMFAGEYKPWDGFSGPAIAQILADCVIMDADDEQARELVASWDLPPHFSTRGVSYSKGVITEHHYLRHPGGLPRLPGLAPGLDLLANPNSAELWIKVYDVGYEVLTYSDEMPALPDHVVSLHRQAVEERRQRSAADGEVPVARYRAEGIEYGYQSGELYRSACSLAARRAQPDEITSVLAEIVEHSQTDSARPWRADQLASMADRAYRRYGKPPAKVKQLEMANPAEPVPGPHEPQDSPDERETMTSPDVEADGFTPVPDGSEPFPQSARRQGAAEKLAAGSDADEAITDAHFAERFAAEVLQDGYCWVAGFGGWMAYREARRKERRGARWFRTTDKSMTNLARKWLIREYEAFKDDNPKAGAAEKKKWEQQLSGYHLREVVSLAAGIKERDLAEFDTHPDLLNCANCVVDQRTGEAKAHDPAFMFTKSTGVDFVPGATHPDWDQALTALPADVLPWYQIRIGQGATGHMPPDDAVLINHGGGENGKSSVLMGICHALGDYYVQAPLEALFGDHSQHPTVRMTFRGARIAGLEETPDEGRLNSQQIKMLTTPRIMGRLMHQDYDPEGYATTHATMINTNHEPAVESTDHGTWRRLILVRYPYWFLKPGQREVLPFRRKGDPGLRDRIIAGQQGQHTAALAWMIEGARLWYEAGQVMPQLPARVQADTGAWRGRANLLSEFVPEHLEPDTAGYCVMSAELYQAFAQAIKASGHKAWSERTFNQRLREYADANGWDIEKKKTKHRKDRLSQPSVFPMEPPESYQAWHGLRFRD
jgi:putative DNA primase/helicase